MQKLIDKVEALINEYNEELALTGIKIDVSKKFFETEVLPVHHIPARPGDVLMTEISRALDRRTEKKKGYKNQRNRYHLIILTPMPIDKDYIPKDHRKDYAYLVKKTERAYIGLKPINSVKKEKKILSRIEKRLQKIIKKAKKIGSAKFCKNSFSDAIRYSCFVAYEYKDKYFGKDRYFWKLFFMIAFAVLAYLGIFILYSVFNY